MGYEPEMSSYPFTLLGDWYLLQQKTKRARESSRGQNEIIKMGRGVKMARDEKHLGSDGYQHDDGHKQRTAPL